MEAFKSTVIFGTLTDSGIAGAVENLNDHVKN